MEEKKEPPKAGAAAAAVTAQTPDAAATALKPEAGAKVGYVKDRPYSAGEAPEIVGATVTRVRAGEVVDLEFRDGSLTVERRERAFSERREPGTWHWPPRG